MDHGSNVMQGERTWRKPGELVDASRGVVSRRIFVDPEIYRLELERVFTRCWLYLGHESQVSQPGDFLSNYMGEDPIILWRDSDGRIRAYLNSCLHRGMKLCRTDQGNARAFTCSYHGWTYNCNGQLTGVPFFKEAYQNDLDREEWRLFEVPKVASYGGFVFGCWDSGAIGLDEYLGDLRWYLDVLIERPLGGLEVLPGIQRYKLPGNWKIQSDNFAGDNYHVPFAHGSWGKLGLPLSGPLTGAPAGSERDQPKKSDGITEYLGLRDHSVAFAHGHGALTVQFNSEVYESDLRAARRFGSEMVDYVEACRDRLAKRLSELQAKVFSWGVGNIFPNLAINNFSTFQPVGIYLWLPKGPEQTEVWQWCAVDRAAPAVIKEMVRTGFTRLQSAAGLFGQDDSDNFEQVTEATRGVMGQKCWFNYQMGLKREREPGTENFPGQVGPSITEQNQRNFYAYWAELMDSATD
jgi:dibenzofuran dioxygenase alpha subunit